MKLLHQLESYLLTLGIPGVFLIAFLDSAAIPLPGGPDAVVLLLSWKYPLQFPLIGLMAAIGSTLGCLFLYQVGRKGGKVTLARFKTGRWEWVREKLDRNAILTMMVAVLVPPPFPTKFFVLGAGVVRMSRTRFIIGILSGRCIRYGGEAYLGFRFGEEAAQALKAQYPRFLLGIAVVAVVWGLVHWFRQRQQREIDLQASLDER